MPHRVLDRIIRINYLIKRKSTGSPGQLASKINVSERTLYGLLGTMKKYGAPIKYDRARKSYYYERNGSFEATFITENT
jgi:predicted DNA-binding transcriptional regulator YafY